MNSAAKLRKRSVATLAASALIIGGVAPAAFAYTAPPAPLTLANQAGAASIGLTDTDPNEAGTQGATVVTPGGSGQDMGEVKFVIPATFEAGDTYTFKIGASTPTNLTDRVSFSSTPAISFDPQAYDATTHIADYSPKYDDAAVNAAQKTSSEKPGATEAGALTKYAPNNSSTMAAAAPQFDVVLSSSGGNNFNDQVTIRFTNNSDPGANTAKFVGTLKGKIDVGTTVTGDIPLTATAADAPGGGTSAPTFLSDTASTTRNITIPATVAGVSLEVANGSVVADGTDQYVGPLTVTAASGQNLAGPVGVKVAGATFRSGVPVTATSYDAAGKVISTQTLTAAQITSNTLSVVAPLNTTKVVFSGMAVTAPRTSQKVTYTLTGAGSTVQLPTGALGTVGTVHQRDILAPPSVTTSQATATAIPTRLGGQDRYQTAVKIAEADLGTDASGPVGESDNVVIASGEGFADALSAGYLAATKNAQLLLTRQGSLPQTDVEFLKTYGAKNIFIVGGYGSVSKAVEDQLKGMQSYDVQAEGETVSEQRTVHDGSWALGTASNGISGTPNLTYTGEAATPGALSITATYPGVAGAATAVTSNMGTLSNVNLTAGTATLTLNGQSSSITFPTSSTASVVGTFGATDSGTRQITTTGNTPGDVRTARGANRKVVPLQANLTVTRLAGSDRFETNKRVNMYAAETATNPVGTTVPEYGKPRRKTAILANGMAPWDALAAGPLVGNATGESPIPVVLTGNGDLVKPSADQIGQMDIKHLLLIGSRGVVSEAVENGASERGISFTRLGGDTRWATAKAISTFALKADGVSAANVNPGFGFASSTNTASPYLTNGGSMDGKTGTKIAQGAWADALAAGPAAARQRTIIALTDSESLPQDTKDLLTANKAALDPVIALGLGDVVSTNAVNQANAAVTD